MNSVMKNISNYKLFFMIMLISGWLVSQLLYADTDNYKNILQVKIQKEFKKTPDYLEISHDPEEGYKMGVYICLGQEIYETSPENAIPFEKFINFANIHTYVEKFDKVLVFMGSGLHKIKKKAEQVACEIAIKSIDKTR